MLAPVLDYTKSVGCSATALALAVCARLARGGLGGPPAEPRPGSPPEVALVADEALLVNLQSERHLATKPTARHAAAAALWAERSARRACRVAAPVRAY
jgi:hypothetical protein